MEFRKTEDDILISKLRAELYSKFTAPIDAMWELLYIASAENQLIYVNGECIGYASIDDTNVLIQLYVAPAFYAKTNKIISQLVEQKLIVSASLSSIEPVSFNAALALSKSKSINTFCFQHSNNTEVAKDAIPLEVANEADIPGMKRFLLNQLGMDDTFGYTENLVDRNELYLVKENGEIIASNEFRRSDTQENTIDLGIVVHKAQRGKGLATKILRQQANRAISEGKKPICSTTIDNIGSKKAIERAGFYCSNIIFDMSF